MVGGVFLGGKITIQNTTSLGSVSSSFYAAGFVGIVLNSSIVVNGSTTSC